MITIPVDSFIFDSNRVDDFCQSLLNIESPNRIFLTALWEAYTPDQEFVKIDRFAHRNNISITWIINNWGQHCLEWVDFKNNIIFFDFFLWRVYNEIFIKKKNLVNSKWNPGAEKYLFLTGKPDKPQRIKLLHLLYSHNMLDNCVYSFFINNGMAEKSRYLLSNLSNSDYQQFISDCRKNPDNITIDEQYDSLHYGGIPYDHMLYTDSKFRIISETSMNKNRPWITEKTWITIANKVPFIIAGDYNSCEYLTQLGFNTFDNLFETRSYDNDKSILSRLDTIIKHTNHWINNDFRCSVADINACVEHNFNQFHKLAYLEKNKFELHTGVDIDRVIDPRDDTTKF
jgi:hypothetical protein